MSKLFKTHERMAVCSVSLVWNIPSRMNLSDVATRMHRPSGTGAQHPQRLPHTVPRDHSESKIKIKSPADCWTMSEAMRKCAKLQWKATEKHIAEFHIETASQRSNSATVAERGNQNQWSWTPSFCLVSRRMPSTKCGFPYENIIYHKKNWKEESKKLYNCLENNANCW